jgi:hypothetical protein
LHPKRLRPTIASTSGQGKKYALFRLYDRNPQNFVPNIFLAKPADYMKATQRIRVSGASESYIALPVVK